ncbi:MAG: hypothetical protein AAF567_03445 [Actinomycetota bacterium]
MSPSVACELNAAIAAAELAVEAGPVGIGRASEAIELLEAVERQSRLAAVARVDAFVVIDESLVYRDHGHATARAMLQQVCRVSSGEAARLAKIARLAQGCEVIAKAWRRGKLSLDQAGVLARAYANHRVRDAMERRQHWFVKKAQLPFRSFERKVADWVNLTDDDGSTPRPDPSHVKRDASMVQDHFARSWTMRGSFGSLQGDQMNRIWSAYIDAEFFVDWNAAADEHGAMAVTRDLLARTDAQRRADALHQIFADALHNPNRSVAIDTVHNIVWSADSLEEMIRRFAGGEPRPLDPDTHRCHGLDGNPLDETVAFADFLVSKFRRVIQDGRSVCIDMGETQRFFTGLARLA